MDNDKKEYDNIYMSVKEVSELLDLNEETVRRAIRKEKLDATFRFNKYFISRDALDAYMADE